MFGEAGPLLDPAFDDVELGGREGSRVARGHAQGGIGRGDTGPEFTVGEIAGDEGAGGRFKGGDCGVALVEAEPGLAFAFIGSVAVVAGAGEDRANLGEVVDFARSGGRVCWRALGLHRVGLHRFCLPRIRGWLVARDAEGQGQQCDCQGEDGRAGPGGEAERAHGGDSRAEQGGPGRVAESAGMISRQARGLEVRSEGEGGAGVVERVMRRGWVVRGRCDWCD